MRHAPGLLALAALLSSPAQGAAHLQTETLNGTLAVETWKARRDARVVKQDADYSCGAASLATLLTHYYGRPTTEKDILDLLTARWRCCRCMRARRPVISSPLPSPIRCRWNC